MKTHQWNCGRCDQENLENPGEIIPAHHRECEKRKAVVTEKCRWCLKREIKNPEWEQIVSISEQRFAPLCKPCAKKRLNNPLNALLSLRRIAKDPT